MAKAAKGTRVKFSAKRAVGRKAKAGAGKKAGSGKSNAWRAYTGVSNAPIPD